MKPILKPGLIVVVIALAACNNNSKTPREPLMNNEEKIKNELKQIDSLLQNEKFALEMAMELEAAYYVGAGQTIPPFFKPNEDSLLIDKSVKEEKIATNVAGFYALECCINYLCSRSDLTPLQWIEKILDKHADDSNILILNRFANATWKAGQPFRSLERIKRSNFISASALSIEEVEKDHRQVMNAASLLKTVMKPDSKQAQLEQLRSLLRDKDFAYRIAAYLDSSYYTGENKPVVPFISPEEMNAIKMKSYREEKIAMNIAGFYAAECAMNYMVTTRKVLPSSVLQELVDNTISTDEKLLFARFANATWKAGQPFRSLDRITRETFTPFNFLNEADVEKDLVQVKAASKKILQLLQKKEERSSVSFAN